MKIKAFITEDEPHSLERLKELLQDFPDLTVVGEAMDGISAVKLINEMKPDLVFMDIQMPGATGFEVLDQIHYDPMIVFVTAFDKYAIRAFEKNAVDYILKPTSKERLTKAVKKVIEKNYKISDMDLIRLKQTLREKDYLFRFIVKVKDEILIFPEEDVYYFKAEDKYIFLYTKDKHFFFDMSLKELEKNLNPHKFCRIHKSAIVAIDKIKKIKKWFHSDYILELKDQQDSRLKVSRNYKAALLEKLK